MTEKELMIGDLIMCHNSNFFVTSVDGYGSLIGIDNERDADLVHIDELTPIPLTAEILEKNGFQCVNNGYETVCKGPSYGPFDLWNVYVLLNERGIFLASEYGRGDTDAHKYSIIHYVHELQHALRLCGLTDLADNFQV